MRFCITILMFIFVLSAFGQSEKKNIRKGNSLYQNQEFEKSETEYLKALEKNPESFEAKFNMGDVLYKQKKYEEANAQFSGLISRLESEKKDLLSKSKLSKKQNRDLSQIKEKLSHIYHNVGNSFLLQKKFGESVKSYIHALKNNPKDEESRYNLAYALSHLKKEQQKQKQEKKDDKNKDQKKDQKKKDDKKKDDKKKEEQKDKKKQQEDKKKKEQQEQQKREKISKKDAERMLQAIQQDEKELQEKLKKKKAKNVQMYIEKNW